MVTCIVDGCGRKHRARGYCQLHYTRLRTHGDPGPVGRLCEHANVCLRAGCDERVHARGLCSTHYRAWRRGESTFVTLKNDRPPSCAVEQCERKVRARGLCDRHYQRFRLTGELGSFDLVDRSRGGSFDKNGYRWVYANGVQRLEHRFVMEEVLGRKLRRNEFVHHKNGIRSDNRRANLELWTSISQPKGQRVTDLLDYARSILARYEGEEDTIRAAIAC